jgi:hypothetical protein
VVWQEDRSACSGGPTQVGPLTFYCIPKIISVILKNNGKRQHKEKRPIGYCLRELQ